MIEYDLVNLPEIPQSAGLLSLQSDHGLSFLLFPQERKLEPFQGTFGLGKKRHRFYESILVRRAADQCGTQTP